MAVRVPTRHLFGWDIADVDLDQAASAIVSLVRARAGALVVTPNVDHIVALERDAELRAVYAEAALLLADGMPLVWLSRLVGRPLRARVTGADLVPALAARRLRLFFLGGRPGAADEAARRFRRAFPDLPAPGVHVPKIGFEADPQANQRAIDAVAAYAPDVLLVAIGSPRQECWMRRHRVNTRASVLIGVGAALDFASGQIPRAPAAMQRAGLEWLYRMMHDRRLVHRYLWRDLRFFGLAAREISRKACALGAARSQIR